MEFNLSEKREKLRKVMICSLVESKILDFGKAEAIIDKCFKQIEKQDKEFIKQESWLLQAYIQGEITWMELCDKRKKLIGGKLI